MAKYTSRFKELAFYVNGERKQFTNGVYETTNKAEDSVLDTLSDVTKAEAKKPEPAKAKTAPRKPTAKK